VYTLNAAQAQDGTSAASYVTFGQQPLWDGRLRGLLTRIYPYVSSETTSVDVTLSMSDKGNENALTSDIQTFDPAGTNHFTTHYRRGRYYFVKFGSASSPWEIVGFDFDRRSGGSR